MGRTERWLCREACRARVKERGTRKRGEGGRSEALSKGARGCGKGES